ncbi:MAG: isochorismate synthase [Acidibacillus sp.]|uniref:isochorismate synthase n=1 Tax=Sulfoacidibacillus ferrooxidans TaxID=2005001 RepID=A0A9X1V6D4_9BACL|nr:isochorismate synthase [Sulfoacidibacillus ferrooxidans]MCI0182114.1 Salicylate biosynthesis isochorismate synthase [Sulfoacidibacillus ferrooxidans]MCY0893239.1 isochorismate synthase [Acidibacillus sp.]
MAIDQGKIQRLWTEQDEERLISTVTRAKMQAMDSGVTAIACVQIRFTREFDWIDSFEQNQLNVDFQVLWHDADQPFGHMLAVGTTVSQMWQDATVLDDIRSYWSSVNKQLVGEDATHVQFFCELAFDPRAPRDDVWSMWPSGLFTLPHLLFRDDEHGTTLLMTVAVTHEIDVQSEVELLSREVQMLCEKKGFKSRVKEAEDRVKVVNPTLTSTDRLVFQRAVADVSEKITQGKFAKVVLARRVVLQRKQSFSMGTALRDLQMRYRSGVLFAVMWKNQIFMGATPERLVQSTNGHIQIDCLAGTTIRGQDEQADRELARNLLESSKDRNEHAHVLNGIVQDVQDIVRNLTFPEIPVIRQLANVQHLYTPVSGDISHESTVLDLVLRLHPTPAVAGLPKRAAMQEIRSQEGMDRGFYAGPLGFMDVKGDGAFNVALRCALIDDQQAVLFAGAGIVSDSNPLAEFAETKWKLLPMQTALEQE